MFAFSPFDEQARSHRWNPLSAVRTNPPHRVGDLLQIGQVFYPNDGNGTSSGAFFNDQARNLFLGIGLYLLETPVLQRLLANSENTLSSIVATFNAPLMIFADTVVDAATSGDDFSVDDVRLRHMSVYLRIPLNRLANARPLLSLFFSQLVALNTQRLPVQDPRLKFRSRPGLTAPGRTRRSTIWRPTQTSPSASLSDLGHEGSLHPRRRP